jgi:hypothetical protein
MELRVRPAEQHGLVPQRRVDLQVCLRASPAEQVAPPSLLRYLAPAVAAVRALDMRRGPFPVPFKPRGASPRSGGARQQRAVVRRQHGVKLIVVHQVCQRRAPRHSGLDHLHLIFASHGALQDQGPSFRTPATLPYPSCLRRRSRPDDSKESTRTLCSRPSTAAPPSLPAYGADGGDGRVAVQAGAIHQPGGHPFSSPGCGRAPAHVSVWRMAYGDRTPHPGRLTFGSVAVRGCEE